MANEQQQHGDQNAAPASAPPSAFAGAARRRFARKAGAMVAAGTVLTLKSQSGMACSIARSPSGMLSGGLDSHKPAVVANGRNCKWWAANSGSWDSRCKSGAMFQKHFTCPTSHPCYNKSVLTLCQGDTDCDPSTVAQLCVAAYQNALTGRTSFLSANQVQKIWNDYCSYGYFSPTAGKQWGSADIVFYLSGTMD